MMISIPLTFMAILNNWIYSSYNRTAVRQGDLF